MIHMRPFAFVATLAAAAALVGADKAQIFGNVAICCEKLVKQFPDQVVSISSASYDEWNHRWADTAELSPTCIFRPRKAEDVSAAVKIFSEGAGNSYEDYCPFSIVSGGHTPWAGGNNIDSGVALELSQLNTVELAEDRSFVRLGPGNTWHSVYEQMDGKGVAFPGGRCPDVGIGGLTLGGGYSWFSGEVGFVSDSVLNFEVVLANGSIIDANANNHADLFRAMKGGSNNFGVLTSIDLKAFEHSQQVSGGLVIVPESNSDEVLRALHNFTDDSTGIHFTSGLTIEYFVNTTSNEGQILLWLIDTDATGDHAALQPFFDMEPKLLNLVYNSSSIADYPTSIPAVNRVLMADATFVNDLEALKAVHRVTMEVKDTLTQVKDLVWDVQYEPLPRHFLEASKAHGGNMMGLDTATEDLMVVFIMPLWQNPQDDEVVNRAAQLWVKEVQKVTQSLGKGHPWEFANYAAGFQDVMGSYGRENVEFMRAVSAKYDPKSLFQKAVSGGYKLSRAVLR